MNSSPTTKLIAMTDIETSGPFFDIHEILEIGLVIFDPIDFTIHDVWETKTQPQNIHTADLVALRINGYRDDDWSSAIDLKSALTIYAEKTQNKIFCAYNATFDWSFISHGFNQFNIENPMETAENHSRLDLLSIAYAKGLNKSDSLRLVSACKYFGIDPEPQIHTALNGAKTAYELFKKIMQ